MKVVFRKTCFDNGEWRIEAICQETNGERNFYFLWTYLKDGMREELRPMALRSKSLVEKYMAKQKAA